MGYTTDFTGQFDLDRPLIADHSDYLRAFSRTRRMKRDAAKTAELPDPLRKMAGLPVGIEGEYFVGSTERFGQDHTSDIIEYNYPPKTQPGLWCQWTPTEDRTAIMWDEGEKFHDYIEWLEYIVKNFIAPWGYKLDGRVRWVGEDSYDSGVIRVVNNVVESAADVVTNPLD
jgi:hypothetical protein